MGFWTQHKTLKIDRKHNYILIAIDALDESKKGGTCELTIMTDIKDRGIIAGILADQSAKEAIKVAEKMKEEKEKEKIHG